MAYEMVMPYHLHMPSYFLGTFTEYPKLKEKRGTFPTLLRLWRACTANKESPRYSAGVHLNSLQYLKSPNFRSKNKS